MILGEATKKLKPNMEGNKMKTIFSSLVVFFVVLVVAQTASAIPISATSADYSALNVQPTSSQYTGSSWHTMFTSIRNFSVTNTVYDVNVEAVLVGVDDPLDLDAVMVTAVTKPNSLFVVDDFSSERDNVRVSEPSLVALIAIGLIGVGMGFVHRMKNH